jgi:hypothetical protein
MTGDIKGAWNVDTDVTSFSGTELVTNGTFASDVTGWTATQSSIVYSSGVLQMTPNSSVNGGAYQVVNTTVGKTYSVTLDVTQDAASLSRIYVGTSTDITTGNAYDLVNQMNLGVGTFTAVFTATTTTTSIMMVVGGGTGQITKFDNVSVKEAVPDRSVKGNGLAVHGTPTVSAVATGAELKCISGFSSSNYLKQAYNADLDFGTGDFSVMGWCKSSNFAGVNRILGRADGVNSHRISLYVSSGTIYIYTNESGSYTYAYTTISTNSWHYVNAVRSSGTVRLYINGVEKATAASTYNLTSTSSAPFMLGAETFDLGTTIDNPFNGSLALWRISATAPSAEQIKEIYEAEKPMFQENAKCTLNGSSDAVTALAYDDSTELLHVGTSGGRSTFQGLRRVDETSTSTTEIAASGGLIVEET